MISRLEIQKARSKWVEKARKPPENKDKLEKALSRWLSQLYRQESETGYGGGALEPGQLHVQTSSAPYSLCDLGKFPNLSGPHFPQL